jgi:hypothetical protein
MDSVSRVRRNRRFEEEKNWRGAFRFSRRGGFSWLGNMEASSGSPTAGLPYREESNAGGSGGLVFM